MVLLKKSKKLLMQAYKDFTTDEGKKFLIDLLNNSVVSIETEMRTLFSSDHFKLYDICIELEQMRNWGMISFEKTEPDKFMFNQHLPNGTSLRFDTLELTEDMRKILEECKENDEGWYRSLIE